MLALLRYLPRPGLDLMCRVLARCQRFPRVRGPYGALQADTGAHAARPGRKILQITISFISFFCQSPFLFQSLPERDLEIKALSGHDDNYQIAVDKVASLTEVTLTQTAEIFRSGHGLGAATPRALPSSSSSSSSFSLPPPPPPPPSWTWCCATSFSFDANSAEA